MVLDAHKFSAVEFDEWVHLPENVNTDYELIAGEIVPTMSQSNASRIGILMGGFIAVHVVNYDLEHTTGTDGGYQVGDERYIPDTGFISKARMPDFESASYISIPPDLE